MQETELKKYVADIREAGQMLDIHEDEEGWANYVFAFLDEVNNGSTDAFLWVLTKILMDRKAAVDKAGGKLFVPPSAANMRRRGNDYQTHRVALASPPAPNGNASMVVANVDMVSETNLIPPERSPRDGFSAPNGLRYSRQWLTGKYLKYPAHGQFGIMRNRIVRVLKVNRTNMDMECMEGPAASDKHDYHNFSMKIAEIPLHYFA